MASPNPHTMDTSSTSYSAGPQPAQPQAQGYDYSQGQAQGHGQSMGMGMQEGARGRAMLYIGNLSPRVTEYMLTEIFSVAGTVVSAKIIPDRHFQHGGINYGFVEYADVRQAEQALSTLNGRKIFDTEIRVNWAHVTQQPPAGFGSGGGGAAGEGKEQGIYHVFVGDLSAEVNDEVLAKAFSAFGTLTEARVMWDMSSGKSRGYGFLAFKDKVDAEQAISTMNGEFLGSRAIRVNWANQKTQTGGARSAPAGGFQAGSLDYATVLAQTPSYNTTVYVGNLIPYSTQADLIPLFQGYGYIVEIRMQADRGFAFVKLDTHENAALAICNLQNQLVHGRPIKCSWGKDRDSNAPGAAPPVAAVSPQQPGAVAVGGMMAGYPGMVYGMPQTSYGQYPAYAGYAGYPAQGASPIPSGSVTPAAAVPAVSSPQQWNAQDPAAAAAYYQQQAGQWGNYYGGQAGTPGQQR